MKLTKEECLDALEEFSELDIKHNDHTTEYIWKESISCKGIEILHQLIKEHFDNPPLKFGELKLNTPYWEDKEKSWCYFTTLNKDRETGVMVDIGSAPKMFAFNFKENSFHAREVKE